MSSNSYQDRGWAWVIAAACTANFMLSMGLYSSLGILLVELMEVLGTQAAETSILMSCFGASFTLSAILMNTALSGVFHERALVLIGSVVGCLGYVVVYIDARIEVVTLAVGICLGLNAQTAATSSTSMIAGYFRKRLVLASSLMATGASVGIFVWPVLQRYLIDEYTYRGASLIVGGILLNGVVLAALMRPYPGTTIPRRQVKWTLLHDRPRTKPEAPGETGIQLNALPEEDSVDCHSFVREEPSSTLCITNKYVRQQERLPMLTPPYPPGGGASTLPGSSAGHGMSGDLETQRDSATTLDDKPQHIFSEGETCSSKNVTENRNGLTETMVSNSTQGIFKTIADDFRRFTLKKQTLASTRPPCKEMFALKMFEKPMFLLFQTFTLFFAVSNEFVIQYYPAVTRDLGFGHYESAYLLSMIGISALISRLLLGFCGDYITERRYIVLLASQAVFGVAVILCRFAVTFWSQVIYALAVGVTYSVFYVYRVAIIRDFFGDDHISKIIPMNITMHGIAMVGGLPFMGWLRDFTGSYHVPLYLSSALLIVNCPILLGMAFLRRSARRK